MGWAWRCTNGIVLFIYYIYHIVFGDGADGVAPGPRRWAVMLIAVFAPSTIAMLTAEGFGFFGAVVDENGTVNHIQSIFSVYPHRDPYPPHSNAQGYAVRRHDDAVL